VDIYPRKFEFSKPIAEIQQLNRDKTSELLEQEKNHEKVAGRIVALRGHGKAGFLNLQQDGAQVQVYVKKDIVGDQSFAIYECLDIGDFIGVEGDLFRTRTGELTIKAESITFLSKALRPLPEKWHGLQDVELRYRQRYLDLIVNPDVRLYF
jgi:lysyl-tRNA synthetase class 2